MRNPSSPPAGSRDISAVIRQVSELRALCLSLRAARNRLREEAGAAELRGAIERGAGTLPTDLRVIRAGLRDLWVHGEYDRIVALGERLPAIVVDSDETILMYVTCADACLAGGPATSTTA